MHGHLRETTRHFSHNMPALRMLPLPMIATLSRELADHRLILVHPFERAQNPSHALTVPIGLLLSESAARDECRINVPAQRNLARHFRDLIIERDHEPPMLSARTACQEHCA